MRYTRAGKRSGRNSFISFISLISVSGHRAGRGRADHRPVGHERLPEGSHRPHAVGAGARRGLRRARRAWPTGSSAAEGCAARTRRCKGAAPFAETQGMLMSDGVMKPGGRARRAAGRGMQGLGRAEERQGGQFRRDLRAGEFNIVLGIELARALTLKVGDKVTHGRCARPDRRPPAWLPRMVNFTRGRAFSRPAISSSIPGWPSSTWPMRSRSPTWTRRRACACAWPTCTRRRRWRRN